MRVNRMDMARAVFDRFGYDHKLLLEAEQTSPTSPLDISMDSSLLDGILAGVDNHNNTTGIAMKEEEQQPGSEVYLKELVDYVFGSESQTIRPTQLMNVSCSETEHGSSGVGWVPVRSG